MKYEKLVTRLALTLLAVMFLGAIFQGGPSGRLFHFDQSIADQTSTFSTKAFDLGESKIAVMTIDFTEVSGGAPTVDCVINSGTTRTTANGDTTGVSFTQKTATGKETKTITDGKFHQYLWATCAMGGTITTVDISVRVTGKP